MRIAGLDKVPSAPMPRSSGVARAVLTRDASAACAARGACWLAAGWSRPSPGRSSPRTRRAQLRRRPGRAGARQSDLERDVVDAAEPAAGPAGGRAAQPQPRLCRRRPVRGGPGLSRRRARGPVRSPPPACAPAPRRSPAPAAIGPGRAEEAGLFDAKADVVALLAELGFDAAKAQLTRDAPAWFHPGRSATLRLGPKIVLAHFGEVHPETLRALDVAGPVAAFEVFLGALPPREEEGAGAGRPRGRRPAARASRLRLRARSRRAGRRCRQGRAGRRQEADRRRQRVRPVRGREPRRGQEVAGAGGHAAADGRRR